VPLRDEITRKPVCRERSEVRFQAHETQVEILSQQVDSSTWVHQGEALRLMGLVVLSPGLGTDREGKSSSAAG
jgi:hypothetical protein